MCGVSRDRRITLLLLVGVSALVGLIWCANAEVRAGHPLQWVFAAVVAGVILWTIVVEWFVVHVFDGMRTAERGHRVREGRCLECGYLLRGVVGDVCPECGNRPPSPNDVGYVHLD